MQNADSIRDKLVKYATGLSSLGASRPWVYSSNADANRMLAQFDQHPLAFVITCVVRPELDAELAGRLPWEISKRLGHFETARLFELNTVDWITTLLRPTTYCRNHGLIARLVYDAVRRVQTVYDGDPNGIWNDCPTSATLMSRLLGFGFQVDVALRAAGVLVRDFGVPVADRTSLDLPVDETIRRVLGRLGLVDERMGSEVALYKARELHPDDPGVIGSALQRIGAKWCQPHTPACQGCPLASVCPIGSLQRTDSTHAAPPINSVS